MVEFKNIEIQGNKVVLNLESEQRVIGEIHETTFVMERNPAKHLMRQWNAYGINAELIDSGVIENVVITEGKETLYASVLDIKAHGRVYKEDGHELQYFLDRDLMIKL